MSVHYRVDMLPLEPYTFGTEQGSKFAGVTGTGKESYIIASENMPEQTTVLGTLRYIILRQADLLQSNFSYDEKGQKEMNEAIGESSFSFQSKTEQSFGKIKKVSPLFLIRKTDSQPEIYIKTPFHYLKSAEGYCPLKLSDKEMETSFGQIRLPQMAGGGSEPEAVYDAKEGHGGGYIRLSDKEAAPEDLFKKYLQTGNRAENENQDKNESFFKRETVILKKGFEFSVYVEAEEGSFPKETIAFMGRKRAAFRFRFTQVEPQEADIEAKVENAFGDDGECWYYALSDLYLEEAPEYDSFSIVESRSMRNIETKAAQKNYVKKRQKSEFQFHLVESGSVFYKKMNLKLDNANIKKIGYNTVVCLGGK